MKASYPFLIASIIYLFYSILQYDFDDFANHDVKVSVRRKIVSSYRCWTGIHMLRFRFGSRFQGKPIFFRINDIVNFTEILTDAYEFFSGGRI